jgi:hypothetical protein
MRWLRSPVRLEDYQLQETGSYTIVVAATWAYNTALTGKYGLSLTKIPPTLPPGIYNPSPANGATITDLNQSFRWDAVAGATGYDLYFGEDVITPLENMGENLSSPEMPFPELEWDTVYYWHVEAHLPNRTIQGPYWWFKTEKTAEAYFDTGPGTYPSIMGTHNGTIIPSCNINVSKLYAYSCEGTGGHTEYAKIYNKSWSIETLPWTGYVEDWHNITFNNSFTLYANETYNYTIRTGSYPQIIHEPSWNATGGVITCTEFLDVNGERHEEWIPAIRLE